MDDIADANGNVDSAKINEFLQKGNGDDGKKLLFIT